MRVDSPVSRTPVEPVERPVNVAGAIQIAVLKKALEGQKQEAAEVQKLLEPKGRLIDILA